MDLSKCMIIATGLTGFFVAHAQAQEIGFGGIEVGVTDCDKAFEMAQTANAASGSFVSAITEKDAIRLKPNAFGFDFVQSGILVCGDGDKISAISLTIPKAQANEIADILAKKFTQKSRNLPMLGGGFANYESKTKKSMADIEYVHVSFTADLIMYTQAFRKSLNSYTSNKQKAEDNKKASAF